MNVVSKIVADLTRPNIGARINAVQGDGNTRLAEITLLCGGVTWTPPEGVEAAIAYMQPGGTKGLYNKLADGTAAISISGNVATVILAPQMLTVSGTVQASLVFNDQQLNRLTTFPFAVSVTSNPSAGAQKVEDYLRLQWLEDKLDEYLKKYEGLTDEAIVRRIVDEYLTANPPTVTETDPTVPAWAKQPQKPTYTAAEVGALPDTYTLPTATETTLGGVKPVTATEAMTQPVGVDAEGRLMTKPGSGGSGISVTGATVGQTVRIAAVDDNGVPTAWEPVDFPSGGGNTTQKEEITTVSVGSEAVVLDGTAPEQVVNLSWAVDNTRTIPAFTNYYIANASYSYPRKFDTSAYTQFFSAAFHGNSDAFVAGHKYFQAMQYSMDDDSTAEIGNCDQYISPTGSNIISGSGWVYSIKSPSNLNLAIFYLGKTSTGTGTINYVYCIDVTALEDAGLVKEGITLNELVELFGGLPLVPGQNYAGGTVGDGTATLSINRNGETITVDNTSSTATVKGGDILSVEGGSVTFLLTVLKTVAADEASVWSGKKWVAFGDSLTDESINADKKYYRYIEEKTGITVTVMGKGGTGYYKTYDIGTAYGQRMAQVPADADIITIFGSVNDWHTKSANVAMGNASDTMAAGTLAGYINECIDVAIEKAPYAQIALVTPMDYHGLPDAVLDGIVDIIKAVAKYRKIKCLDLYHESGFRVDNPVFAQQFTTDCSEAAESYGHPNNLAHERLIAPEFMELLKRMLLTA